MQRHVDAGLAGRILQRRVRHVVDDRREGLPQVAPIDIEERNVEKAFAPILDYVPFTALQNATGQPGINLPLHWNAAGLPIGVQFVSRNGGEMLLLRLAAQLEEAAPWISKTPSL